MKKYCITIGLTCLILATALGQNKSGCNCPKNSMKGSLEGNKPDTAFHFSNNNTIILCGYKNPDSDPKTFSEFTLSICGQDTIIDFWGAVLTCKVKAYNDTLFVDQLESLPIGKKFKFQKTVWMTEKIFFSNDQVGRMLTVNRNIRKYTEQEINSVLTEFENTIKGFDIKKMELVYKLFIATISGSITSRQYFKEFGNKFWTLDGGDKEEYDDLRAMLALWDK